MSELGVRKFVCNGVWCLCKGPERKLGKLVVGGLVKNARVALGLERSVCIDSLLSDCEDG